MKWIVLEAAIPVFLLMVVGIWMTIREFKKEIKAEKKELDEDDE